MRSNLEMSAPRSASRTIKREWHDRAFVDLDEESDDGGATGGREEADAGADAEEEAEEEAVEEVDMMDDFGGEGANLEEVEVEAEEVEEMEEEEDAQGETDEEMTIHLKPPEEQEEIAEEIADLEENVPQLVLDYKVIDRLGTGTFSSVYKALDLHYHSKWDNTAWQGSHPLMSSAHYQTAPRPLDAKFFVAVKRIYVTSGPERIRNEITIMEDCRGCRHVSQLITAFRNFDQVVAIMPYHRHEDFRVRFTSLNASYEVLTRLLCESLGLLQDITYGRYQRVHAMSISRVPRYSCEEDHSPRRQTCQLLIRPKDGNRNAL